jgi:amino acid adenylation domain-containing protein
MSYQQTTTQTHIKVSVGDDPVEYLTDDEKSKLRLWSSQTPETVEACVSSLFEKQVCQQGQAPAVCSWDGELTYDELNGLVSRLAGHLVEVGVGPEVLVPLSFEKSKWAIVAILAVLKAGGAFVPLDPTHPLQRQKSIIAQTNSTAILTSSKLASSYIDMARNIIIVEGAAMSKLPATEDGLLGQRSQPANLAYVLFTSGSTGQPKGVMIEHSAICSSSLQHGRALKFGKQQRVLQFSSYTFDVSVMDILTTLIFGGCICVPSEEERFNDIVGFMNRTHVTLAVLTPSFVRHIQPDDVLHLQTLIMAGETLTPEAVKTWSSRVELFNAYGPAECAVICSTFTHGSASAPVPPATIGKAVGSKFWIVEPADHNKLAHVDAVGELVVEGPIVARGYLNDSVKTGNAFIPVPRWRSIFGTYNAGQRMYKTSDLVRYNPDGTLVYVGRKDSQVKLHGQRIELNDIEHHLRRFLPDQMQVVADLVCPAEHGKDSRLGAFICVGDDWGCSCTSFRIEMTLVARKRFKALTLELEKQLRQVLPVYMIPTLFVPLPRFLLTASAKIDRNHLRTLVSHIPLAELLAAAGSRSTGLVEKLTETESKLAALWAEILQNPALQILPADNFFRLGGNSLAAIGLVAISRQHGFQLTVADIFKFPQLRDMSLSLQLVGRDNTIAVAPFSLVAKDPVEAGLLLDEASTQCSIPRHLIADLFPCTPYQEELWQESMHRTGSNCVQRIFTLSDGVDIDAFTSAWSAVQCSVLHHRIIASSRGFLQVIPRNVEPWSASRDLTATLASHRSRIGKPGHSLSLCTIVEGNETSKWVFVWTAHHALYDRWSVALLFDQVANLYQKRPDDLPATNFNTFVQHVVHTNRIKAAEFWRSRLAGAVSRPVVTSQTKSTPDLRSDAILEHWVALPKSSSSFTTATMLYATWSLLAGRITNSKDVTSSIMLTGRNSAVAGIERLLGPTIAVVPLRVNLNHLTTTHKLLTSIQDAIVDFIPFQHFGYQNIGDLSDEAKLACTHAVPIVVHPREMSWGPNIGVILDKMTQLRHPASPLVWNFTIEDGRVFMKAQFDKRFVSEQTIQTWLTELGRLLTQVAGAGPQHALADFGYGL